MINHRTKNNDKLPLISVVMPVYNAEKYLDESITSILDQTYQNFEFIIINDGSTDRSLKILQKYKDNYKNIILINRDNKGLIKSLNEGLNLARGKYIARMDSDDISLPERFYKQIKIMEEERLDICGGHYFLIDENSAINGMNLTPRSHDLCTLALASMVPFAHPSVMIRNAFLRENNLRYGQSKHVYAEDLDLWERIYSLGGRFGNVDDVIFKYRLLTHSLSRRNRHQLKKDTKNIQTHFVRVYQVKLLHILDNLPKKMNIHEQSLIVRFCFRYILIKFNFRVLKYLGPVNKKIIFWTIISEIKNV